VKQKTVSLVFVLAFILVWACTPSSLFKTKKDIDLSAITEAIPVPSDNKPVTPVETPIDSSKLQAVTPKDTNLDPLQATALPDSTLLADTLPDDSTRKALQAATANDVDAQDIITEDTLLPAGQQAKAALKRDTTLMDSLELAIYKYNKVIDDSLRKDSLNRKRKNGIDAPVVFSANDSLIYEASTGMAHLFGSSHVEYQNMDLKSDKIYMCLDSSLVHATGSRDSLDKMFGTPVFKMGSDEYQSDTMAFNFKTKKGLIQQVYTEQEDGYLTAEQAKRGGNGELFLGKGRIS